ncbi:Helicase conserved C-terminal domain-containing protein [Lachnospiraceae bacterium]|nr:Helicase conserved C-terminal domain-containing protein [Lachnospiraceae bacterium]
MKDDNMKNGKYLDSKQQSDISKEITNSDHHSVGDCSKTKLKFHGVESNCALVSFGKEYVYINVEKYAAKWILKNEKFILMVPFRYMEGFLEDISVKGEYGFIASDDLMHAYDKYKKMINNPATLKPLDGVDGCGNDTYELSFNDYLFNRKLLEHRGEFFHFMDSQNYSNKVLLSTDDTLLPELLSFLENENVDVSAVRNRSKTDRNVSENTLVDIDSLNSAVKPYPYQIEDADKIIKMKRALIAHEMGCGKTKISLFVGISIEGCKLIICPESLRLNWQREILQVDKNADIIIVKSNKEPDWNHEWIIMGYKTAVKYYSSIPTSKISCLFVDEAHKCKAVDNYGRPGSKQANTVIGLADAIENVYLITGTPMPTSNKDLYNILVILKAINPNINRSFFHFGLKYCNAHETMYGWDFNGSSNTSELHKFLSRYMVRRLRKDVLPDLNKNRIPIITDNSLPRDYISIEKRLIELRKTDLIAEANNDNIYHRKNPNKDTYMGLAMTGRRLLSACKLKTAIEMAKELYEDEKSVVLVTEFVETMENMEKEFKQKACYIKGGMSDAEKQMAIDQFQKGEKKICCMSLIAAGVGITLTKAHHMIICDLDWTPANMVQVEDRICRDGQTESCNIYYVCHKESILDNIFINMITEKSENIDQVVDQAENTIDLVKMINESNNKEANTFISILKMRLEKIIENE